MPALYSHTTRATGTIVTAAIYNGDHENHITYGDAQYSGGWSSTAAQMRTTSDPGESGSESLASSVSDELERLRFAILEIKQALDSSLTYWYESPRELASMGRLPPWYIEGLELSVVSGAQNHIQVATGVCRDSTDSINMRVSTARTRGVTALWVTAATGGGVGVTWAKRVPYHAFVIKTAASTFDIGFDTVLTASNVLARASGTYYRRIGSLNTLTDAGLMQVAYQRGNEVIIGNPNAGPSAITILPSGNGLTSVKIVGLPTGIRLQAKYMAQAAAPGLFLILDEPVKDVILPDDYWFGVSSTVNRTQFGYAWSNTSGDVALYHSGAGAANLCLLGWRDERK